jgi:bacterioferritin
VKGDPKVIELLNEVLTAELTAINQYFVHAKMCGNWGYEVLRKDKWDESIQDMKDADALIDRILLLDGVPNMQRYNPVMVGEDVAEMHRLDLQLELAAVERLNRAIAVCRDAGDNGTRTVLEEILGGEEEAVDHLEAQLELIDQVGLQNYLATQIHEE